MSHSKMTKRGSSHFLNSWNPSAKKYINTCVLCGRQGYSPVIEDEGFSETPASGVIYRELKQTMTELSLDEWGRCSVCANVQGGQRNE